jgi:hypothetical protein
MGNNQEPITLHKYLYANVDPGNNIDPSGHMTLTGQMAAVSTIGVLSAISVQSYQMGQSLTGGAATDGGYTSSQTGWLMLAAMSGAGSTLYDLIRKKLDEREDTTVDLFRVVDDYELASLYTLGEFALGPNQFPKQFFEQQSVAFAYATDFMKPVYNLSHFHMVETTISQTMYNSLIPGYEPGYGPYVTVPDGMLPAFNLDSTAFGGWRYLGTY